MPWRLTRNPYRILVSEIMLQQTGIERVKPKYAAFLRTFPTFRSLANAEVADVLAVWKGLGYNRRALALRETAGIIASKRRGRMPRTLGELIELPGIGRATASAVLVYSFDQPIAFIETNIRRTFIHHFFPDASSVSDARILPLVEKCLDRKDPRQWYYALMDYGAMLGKNAGNPNRRSAAYKRQPAFEGSLRQLRGKILAVMLERRAATQAQIAAALGGRDARIAGALRQLVAEGFLARDRGRYAFR
jgi:A/G-specific adenine glycosylase